MTSIRTEVELLRNEIGKQITTYDIREGGETPLNNRIIKTDIKLTRLKFMVYMEGNISIGGGALVLEGKIDPQHYS